MLDPSLVGSTPFNNRTALVDLAGILELMHAQLAPVISERTGIGVRRYPLGSGGGSQDWLEAITRQHADERSALGLIAPVDYTEFRLKDASEFASFVFLLANDLQQIRVSAGVV